MKILKVGNFATTFLTMLVPTQTWGWEDINNLAILLRTHLDERLSEAEVTLFTFQVEDLLNNGSLELSGDNGNVMFELTEPVMFELL